MPAVVSLAAGRRLGCCRRTSTFPLGLDASGSRARLCEFSSWGALPPPPRPPRVRAGPPGVLSEAGGCCRVAGPGCRAVGGAGKILSRRKPERGATAPPSNPRGRPDTCVPGAGGTRSRLVRDREVVWAGGDGCRAVGGERKMPSGRKPTGGLPPPARRWTRQLGNERVSYVGCGMAGEDDSRSLLCRLLVRRSFPLRSDTRGSGYPLDERRVLRVFL